MNLPVPTEQTSTREIGFAIGAGGTSIAPKDLGEVIRFAEVMCRADIALPKHLRGNAGACMAIALQALEWQMSPFAVASKSYAVNGAIAYEAQLIAAVVNTRSGIKGRLKYEFLGAGDELTCRVSGTLDGDECTYETPALGAITPKNSPLWKTDPRQQLGYYAARSWARRHCPEVILGVYDRDEAEHRGPDNAKDVTPSVMQRLKDAQQRPQEGAQAREGFSPSFAASEAASLSSGLTDTSAAPVDDGGDGTPPVPTGAVAAMEPQEGGSTEEGDNPGAVATEQPAPSSGALSDDDRRFLCDVFKRLSAAVGPDVAILVNQVKGLKTDMEGRSTAVRAKASTIRNKLEECCGEDPKVGTVQVRKYVSGLLGVDERELQS